MSPEILASVVAVVLSLAFSYIPGLNVWYAGLGKEVKQLIMLLLLVVVAGVSYGLACAGWLTDLTGIVMACDKASFLGLVRTLVVAIIANQGVYSLSPNTAAVRNAKA
jgi:hypothetical protein